MLSYFSKTSGIGGTIKNTPGDFIVEEITKEGTDLELNKKIEKKSNKEGKFVHFILQKANWSTADAIKAIAKLLRISHSRFNFAGTKDKVAISTQLVSCFGIDKEKIEMLNIKDIKINGAWYSDKKINLGELLGNRFTIKIENAKTNSEETIMKIYGELEGKIPNYFGEQRFGTTRKNTHVIGEKLIRARLKDAAMSFLCDIAGEENQEAKLAREELAANQDFEQALKTFPKHLRLERSMIGHLAENEKDFAGAFRKLPRNILLLFIHAFQSYLFNIQLSDRIAQKELQKEEGEYFCGENICGFPDLDKKQENGFLVGKIIGYETKLNECEEKLLKKFEIRKEDFKIKSLPEISSKGAYRPLFVPLKDFSFIENTFKFSLPSGSYATIAIREFLDNKIRMFD